MIQGFGNLIQLQKHFNNELTCVQYLENLKWSGKPVCPKCGCEKLYRFPTRLKHPDLIGYKDFQCSNKECKKMFSVLTNSIFEGSKISLQVWFAAMYLISAHKKGISSHQLARDLGLSQKSGWFILHRVRAAFSPRPVGQKIFGLFSADETFIGGANKNRHQHKKVEGSQGRSCKDKTPVFGIMQTGGIMRTTVITDTKATTLKPIIKSLVARGSIVITDEWLGYNGLKKDYMHIVVNHSMGEYTKGAFSPNNVENFWSLLNRGIYGIYHQVSPKHLHRYCYEFEYRYNLRKMKDATRFIQTVVNSDGKRLTWKLLTEKPPEVIITEDGEIIG